MSNVSMIFPSGDVTDVSASAIEVEAKAIANVANNFLKLYVIILWFAYKFNTKYICKNNENIANHIH